MQTGLHYPIPVHLQEAHADLGYKAGDFPQSEAAADEVLSLPMYPEMTSSQVEQVVAAARARRRMSADEQSRPDRCRPFTAARRRVRTRTSRSGWRSR